MYDDFSADYDRFVDWPGRLAAELPFIERQLQEVRARRVLDTACGTGMHALALARRGYDVVGTDLSPGMIDRAQVNAATAEVDARFEVAGFGELSTRVGAGFDAVLCLGNSLPHVLTSDELAAALTDFAACLRPGGLLLVQNRNFDAVLGRGERWMEPQSYREGEAEWIFVRFYDFEPGGMLAFNLVTLRRGLSPQLSPYEGEEVEGWSQRVTATRLWPLRQRELTAALVGADFREPVCLGNMQGAPFDADRSTNLVVTAFRVGG